MPELSTKPQSSLVLADAELAALAKRLPRWAVKKYGEAVVVDAEYLRRLWNELLQGCRLLTEPRYTAVGQRFVDGYELGSLEWALRAYAKEIGTDMWRKLNPQARRTMESFFQDGRLDIYIDLGLKLKESEDRTRKAAAARLQENKQSHQLKSLYQQYKALPAAERAKLLEQALAAIGGAARAFGHQDESNPMIRNKLCQLIQRRQQQAKLDVAPIGSVLEEK